MPLPKNVVKVKRMEKENIFFQAMPLILLSASNHLPVSCHTLSIQGLLTSSQPSCAVGTTILIPTLHIKITNTQRGHAVCPRSHG